MTKSKARGQTKRPSARAGDGTIMIVTSLWLQLQGKPARAAGYMAIAAKTKKEL